MHTKEDKNTTRYYIKNKEKVKSGRSYFICRSSGEYKFCAGCDVNPDILFGESEPVGIPYINPTKINSKGTGESRYYPDFLLKCKNKQGEEKIGCVEIKPNKDIISKPSKNKSKKTVLYEQKTQLINKAKFKAAKRFCDRKGWIFKLITEKELFGDK